MAKLQTFRIQKRFEVWVEREIQSPTIEDALALAKSVKHDDFFKPLSNVEVLDVTTLSGTTVGEEI